MKIDDQFSFAVYCNIDSLRHALSLEKIDKSFLAVHSCHTDNAKALIRYIAGILRDHFRIHADIPHMCIQ